MLPAISTLTLYVAATLSVYLIRPERGRLRKVLLVYAAGAMCYVAMGILTLLLPREATTTRIAVCLLLQAGFGAFVFSGDPHYSSMLVEITSMQERGRFFGVRVACFGAGGVLGGLLASLLLRFLPPPAEYGFCFLAGGLLILVSVLWFTQFRETQLPEKVESTSYVNLIRSGISVLRNHGPYRLFVLWHVAFLLMMGVYPFLSIRIHDRLHLPEAIMGQLAVAFTLATVLFSPLLGWIGDHLGHRLAMRVSTCSFLSGLIIVTAARSYPLAWLGFLLCSCDLATSAVVTPNYAYALLPRTQPAKVMSALMCVGATVRTVSYLSIGALLDRWSYQPVIVLCVFVGGVSFVLSFALKDEGIGRRAFHT
jgi:MFS family permease